MKILVLGPSGQLGTDFVRAARELISSADLALVGRDRLDVSDYQTVRQFLSQAHADVVVNFTSYHKTDEVEGNATLAFRVNAFAVREMACACASQQSRFIHVSTDYVYGGDRRRTIPYVETDPPSPINVYGASKAMGETLALNEWSGATVLRVASLFGVAGASGKGGNFVETMLRVARDRGELRVVDDQTMSPTSTADTAAAICRLIAQGAPAGLYNLVNSGATTWFGFASEILRAVGLTVRIVPISSTELSAKAERPKYSALNNSKVAGIVGTLPHWCDALQRYLRAKGYVS